MEVQARRIRVPSHSELVPFRFRAYLLPLYENRGKYSFIGLVLA